MWAPCYADRLQYHPFANLFLYNALNLSKTWDGGAEYEAMSFNYVTEDQHVAGFLGYADDNWIDGTQSFTFNFLSPLIVQLGYGLTATQIHEYGHHFGMSHPHDGYDYETGREYGPVGDLLFAWSGDEVNSVMNYLRVNFDFSQFDRDNANRFKAAAYVVNLNAIAKDVLTSASSGAALSDLRQADDEIGRAKAALAAHDYVSTFDHAKRAYDYVRAGAAKAGVAVAASSNGWTVLPPTHGFRPPFKRDYSYQDKYGPGTHYSMP